jgi:streptogramin lyase
MKKILYWLSAMLLSVAAPNCLAAACGPVYGADSIAQDKDGNIWVAHYEDVRLGRLEPNNGRFEEYLPSTQVSSTLPTPEVRIDKDGFSYKYDFGFNGLALDDKRGLVWSLVFNSDKVIRFSRKDRLFAEVELPGRSFGRFTLPIDADGNLWVLAGPCCGQEGDMQLVKIGPDASKQVFLLQAKKAIAPNVAMTKNGQGWVSLTSDDDKQAALYAFRDQDFERIALPAEIGRIITRLHVDAQGDLWLAEGDVIWRLHNNEFKRYTIPTPGAHPSVLAGDGKGNLWFTEWHGNKIGRIAADGNVTEFPIPAEEESPLALTVAADGKVWFSTMFNYELFRLDPATGKIQSFPLPMPSNWSKNAAAGLSACVIKPKDALTMASAKASPVATAPAGTSPPLRHPKGYPDEPGAAAFEQNCHSACHSWYRMDKAASRRSDWRPTVERMIDFNKAAIPAEQRELIVDYLNKHYTMAKH